VGAAQRKSRVRSRKPAAEAASVTAVGRRLRWRRPLLMAGILLLILTAVFPGAVLRNEVYVSADARNADAFRSVGDAGLADGHYPLWNPYLFAGMPTFGSLAYVRFLYPPATLFNFLQQRLGFPPLTWLLVHLLVGGLGMAYLLSQWRLPLAAQLLGATVWILLPKVVAWGVHGHGSKLGAAMYLPWILAWSWQVLGGRGARAVAITALLLGLQFLRGHLQISYYTLLTVAYFAFCYGLRPLDKLEQAVAARLRWQRVGQLAVAVILGFMIGAILLLPVQQYAAISIRGQDAAGGVGFDYATGWSLAPAELATLVLPSHAGFGAATYLGSMPFTDYPNYLGFLLLSLAALAWATGRRWLAGVISCWALMAILVACGRYSPGVYQLLYDTLPFFNKFRVPSMVLILTGLAVAMLAPAGATWLSQVEPASRRWRRYLPVGFAALGALLLLGAFGLARGPYQTALSTMAAGAGKPAPPVLLDAAWQLQQADLMRIGLILVTTGAALWYAVRNMTFRKRGLIWVLAALVALDLGAVGTRIVHPERSLLKVAYDQSGAATLVAASPLGRSFRHGMTTAPVDPIAAQLREAVAHDRVWPLSGAARDNRYFTAGVRSLGGYHPAKLATFEQIRRRLYDPERPAGRLASWLAATVVALDVELPADAFGLLRELGADLDPEPLVTGGTTLYHNRAALPRARLVTRYRLVSSLPEEDALGPFLDAIQTGRHRFADEIVLESTPVPRPQPYDGTLPPVSFVSDGLTEVVLRAETPVPALLLLADMHTDGWQVSVDGQPGELLRADLCLRAVALPAGTHEVRFHYHDRAVGTGLTITLAALTGVALLLVWPVIPWRRRIGQEVSVASAPDDAIDGGEGV